MGTAFSPLTVKTVERVAPAEPQTEAAPPEEEDDCPENEEQELLQQPGDH